MATQQRTDGRTGTGRLMETDSEPHMRDLIKQLAGDGGDLVRSEIALAKLEMRDMAREVALDSAKLAAAVAFAMTGALALVAALIVGVGNLLDGRYALAALIVGTIILIVGGLLARGGIAGLKNAPRAELTARTMKENREWAGREVREFREEIRS